MLGHLSKRLDEQIGHLDLNLVNGNGTVRECMRRIRRNGIELLGPLAFVGRRLFVLAAVIEGFELVKDEIQSILLNGGGL